MALGENIGFRAVVAGTALVLLATLPLLFMDEFEAWHWQLARDQNGRIEPVELVLGADGERLRIDVPLDRPLPVGEGQLSVRARLLQGQHTRGTAMLLDPPRDPRDITLLSFDIELEEAADALAELDGGKLDIQLLRPLRGGDENKILLQILGQVDAERGRIAELEEFSYSKQQSGPDASVRGAD